MTPLRWMHGELMPPAAPRGRESTDNMRTVGWLPEVLEVGGARRADAPSIIGTAQGETSRRPEAGVGQPSLPTIALDLAAALVYAVDHDLRRTIYRESRR